jgi:hypothetical protein
LQRFCVNFFLYIMLYTHTVHLLCVYTVYSVHIHTEYGVLLLCCVPAGLPSPLFYVVSLMWCFCFISIYYLKIFSQVRIFCFKWWKRDLGREMNYLFITKDKRYSLSVTQIKIKFISTQFILRASYAASIVWTIFYKEIIFLPWIWLI